MEQTNYEFENLKTLFENYDRRIKYYGRYMKASEMTKEKMIRRRECLLSVAQSLSANDLQLLYYIKVMDGTGVAKMLSKLKKIYQTRCGLWSEIEKMMPKEENSEAAK